MQIGAREFSVGLHIVTCVAALAGSGMALSAQEQAEVANPEADLNLECKSLNESLVDVSIAIDAKRKRGRVRPHSSSRARLSYGVVYTPTHIRLYPNREAPNPPPMNFEIDRETLVLTYFKSTFPVTHERVIIGTGLCTKSAPDPELER